MSVAKNTIANLAGAILPMLVALIAVPRYLHLIGPERYGVLAVVWALLGYFGFMDLGLGRAVTQRIARTDDAGQSEHRDILWTAISVTFLVGTLGSVLLWLGGNYLLDHVIAMAPGGQAEVREGVVWITIALPVVLLGSALSGALQARLMFVELNAIQILTGVAGQLIPLSVAALGYVQLRYLVPATLFVRCTTIGLLWLQCRRHVPLVGAPRISREHLIPMLTYGGWISVTGILGPLLVTIDRVVIASLSGARAVAQYTVPFDLVSRVMVIAVSLSGAIFPRLASLEDSEGRQLAMRASEVLLSALTPITIIGLLLSHQFLIFWVGKDFAYQSRGVAEFLLLGVWFNAIVVPHHTRYLARENPRNVAIVLLIELPVYFILLWQGIVHWGVAGAALAWCLRVLLDTVLLLRLNNALLPVARIILPYLILVAASGIATMLVEPLEVLIVIAAVLLILCLYKDRQQLALIYSRLSLRTTAME